MPLDALAVELQGATDEEFVTLDEPFTVDVPA